MSKTAAPQAHKDESTTEALQAEIARLKALIVANRSAPEFSAVFVTAKERAPIKWSNLSETKRYFEAKQPELLKLLTEKAETSTLTSDEFHLMMRSAVGAWLA